MKLTADRQLVANLDAVQAAFPTAKVKEVSSPDGNGYGVVLGSHPKLWIYIKLNEAAKFEWAFIGAGSFDTGMRDDRRDPTLKTQLQTLTEVMTERKRRGLQKLIDAATELANQAAQGIAQL